jgi:protoheme IX farnesyltransferase
MSTSAITVEKRRAAVWNRGLDYLELTKPKIAVLELVTVAAAALLAGFDGKLLLHALLGTTLVAASASAFNQWLERHRDGSMRRTANRPLPAGRLTAGEVFLFGTVAVVAGVIYLALFVNLLTAALGALSWILYVLIYTPLKSRTSANTLVGAVAGAMPILMGWSAMGQPLDLKAFTLFLIVFLWQFPHFMAIAWLYREDYAAAGLKMLPVVEPTGLRAGAQAALAALVLIPVSLVPAVVPLEGNWLPPQLYVYFGWACLLGVGQLACAISFFWRLDDRSARRLLRASLIYLPGLMIALVALLSTLPA